MELTVPGSGGRRRPGITVHRCEDAPHDDDIRLHVDLRVSSVPRMLIELAARETPRELERLVTWRCASGSCDRTPLTDARWSRRRSPVIRELDRFWPDYHLAVELDGRPYHVAVADMERDRLKDTALQRLGLTPLRFTDFRVEHDQRGILGDLRHFLRRSPPERPAL